MDMKKHASERAFFNYTILCGGLRTPEHAELKLRMI